MKQIIEINVAEGFSLDSSVIEQHLNPCGGSPYVVIGLKRKTPRVLKVEFIEQFTNTVECDMFYTTLDGVMVSNDSDHSIPREDFMEAIWERVSLTEEIDLV